MGFQKPDLNCPPKPMVALVTVIGAADCPCAADPVNKTATSIADARMVRGRNIRQDRAQSAGWNRDDTDKAGWRFGGVAGEWTSRSGKPYSVDCGGRGAQWGRHSCLPVRR